MQARKQHWVRITIVAIGLTVFLAYAIIPEWFRLSRKSDIEGAVPQQGVATVAILVRPGPVDLGNPTTPQVSVRFQGQLLSVKAAEELDALAVGQPAQIEYRVGKSGRIYVDRVRPLPEPRNP
jgi:hypothetical protein